MLCCHFWLTFCAFVCVVFVFANSRSLPNKSVDNPIDESIVFVDWAVESDPETQRCKTPLGNTEGKCINVKECEPMMDFLASSTTGISTETVQLLKKYKCGFEGRDPKVCCPPTEELFPEQPADIKNHKNFHLLPTNCGPLDSTQKVIGGNKTLLLEFPWMALISYKNALGPNFLCAGSILNDRYILTAAHCITRLRFPLLGVRVGEHDISHSPDCDDFEGYCAPPHQDLAIEEVIVHPQYNLTAFRNDIGLIRVSKMLMKDNVKPICMPIHEESKCNITNRNLVVTGWGATEKGTSSPDLLKAELPLVSLEECQRNYRNFSSKIKITQKQMCAGGKGDADSCNGDSGGPLQLPCRLFADSRYIQHGIVSFGPQKCATENRPGVYTKVVYYLDWILDNIRE